MVNAERASGGKYKVPLLTGKAPVEAYLRTLRSQNRLDAVTFVYPGFFWQNFGTIMKPQRQSDGSFVFSFPVDPATTSVWSMDIHDLGPVVAQVLAQPKTYDGQRILVAAECLTLADIVRVMGDGNDGQRDWARAKGLGEGGTWVGNGRAQRQDGAGIG